LPETVTRGTIALTWDADSRVATLRFDGHTQLTGPDARFLTKALGNWACGTAEPFAMLFDGSQLASADAENRAVSGKFWREHRDRSHIAMFNVGPVMRVVTEMFRLGTGVHVKGFADEATARAWLRSLGIRA
jgi:hypothetical protein